MEAPGNSPDAWATVTPRDLFRLVLRRFPSVLVTTVVVTAIVVGLLLVWPNRYSSDGLFYARLGRGAVSIDPTTEVSRSVSLQESRASEVASISEMITSREIADRVVDRVGAREINFPRTWIDRTAESVSKVLPSRSMPQGQGDGDQAMDRTEYDRQLAHENAVERVQKSIEVKVPKNSYTVSVTATQSDPLLAQKLVQAIMDEFGAYHVKAHESVGSMDFFVEQTERSHQAAIAAREALQQARSEMGWISIESAEESLRERILNLELALDTTESEFADAKRRSESIAARIKTIEEWVPMQITRVANNAADGMRTALYEYQIQDGEKLSRVTENHPRYKVLRDKIAQGEQIVSDAADNREQTVEAVNPIRLGLETDYQTAMTMAAGHESRRESLIKSLASARADLQRLNRDSVKLSELTWAADVAEKNYLSHCESLESARMTNELDTQNMSDISVIQNASLNLKKVGPPRGLLAMVGMLLGVCLGLLQALVRDEQISDVGETPVRPVTKAAKNGMDHRPLIEEDLDVEEEREFVSSMPR